MTREECKRLVNAMAGGATENPAAARVALKAQIACLLGDWMEDAQIPYGLAAAEVLEEYAAGIREQVEAES